MEIYTIIAPLPRQQTEFFPPDKDVVQRLRMVATPPFLLTCQPSPASYERVKLACPTVEETTEVIDTPSLSITSKMALNTTVHVRQTTLLLLLPVADMEAVRTP